MPGLDSQYIDAIDNARGLWASGAKAAVLESLRRAQFASFDRWRTQWQALHSFYDGEHCALVRERIKITHPERSKDWLKQESGLRFVPIVRAWTERVSVIFHRPPTTFLHRGNGVPLEEDHPAVVQWRKDAKQVQIDQTLMQVEAWTNLMGQAFVQPAWIKGSQMRWLVHTPYEVTIDQDPELPDEIDGAYVTVEIRQPLDTLGVRPTSLFASWRKDGDRWNHWITDDRGGLKNNSLFPDNVSRYTRPGSGHPFVVFRRERPAPGLFYVPPDESLLQLQMATNLKTMDLDWILRYQVHAQPVITGQLLDHSPTMGPARILEFPDRDGSFTFASPSPNLAEFRESFNFDLCLAAVATGMPPDTFEPVSTTRNLASKQLENYNLMLKREKAIPSYIAAMDKVWECHRMVGNYWAEQTGTRYRYEDGLMLGLRLAPIPQVFDRFQDVQSTIQELSNGLTSIVEATQRREGVTREEAIRRVEERRKDEMVGRQDALKESGATEQIVEVETTNGLNGAQVVAAKGIVEAVSVGTLPRDAGLGMLRILFNLSDAQAGLIMGSAGGSFVPAAPDEPGTAAPAPAPGDGDGAPPTKAAAGEGVPRPPSARDGF